MDKRYIIAAALTFLVLIAWQYYFAPPPRQPATPQEGVPVETTSPDRPPETAAAPAELPSDDPPPEVVAEATVEAVAEEEITIETADHRVVLTNRGGRVVSWTLRNYSGRDGEPLQAVAALADHGGRLPLGIELADPSLASAVNEALHQVERESLPAGDGLGPGTRVRFRWADGRGLESLKTLEFRDDDPLVAIDAVVTDRGRRLPVGLTWGPGFETRHGAGGLGSYYYANQVLWNLGGQVSREKKLKEEIGGAGNLLWAGIEDQYFTALLIPRDERAEFRFWTVDVVPGTTEDGEVPTEPEPRPMVGVSLADNGALLFVGAKEYKSLKALGFDLQEAVWFSSVALFAWMARILYAALIWIYANMVPNYGVAIILTTVALRIVLFPLNQFSMVRIKKTQTEMQKVQPKINAIKNKYRKKKDAESRAQMNQEVMALYKKEGINPMGGMTGCLPMLAQFPILIGFYDMLLAAVELRGAPFFGWIQDLTLKDPYYVTPLLMGVTMFLQQKMSMTKGGDPTQQRIMMMTPVIFTVMFLNLPSGLVLYWFVNNLLGIGQQWLVNRHIGKMEKAS
jgi:YidC/Oxa1 family membrane protein insertase